MSDWLRAGVIAAAVVVSSWGLLLLAARRLPPGLLRVLAGFIPACVTTVRRLRRDPRVPRRAKLVVTIAGLWVLSPIDLIPEFLPVALAPAHGFGRTRRPRPLRMGLAGPVVLGGDP